MDKDTLGVTIQCPANVCKSVIMEHDSICEHERTNILPLCL